MIRVALPSGTDGCYAYYDVYEPFCSNWFAPTPIPVNYSRAQILIAVVRFIQPRVRYAPTPTTCYRLLHALRTLPLCARTCCCLRQLHWHCTDLPLTCLHHTPLPLHTPFYAHTTSAAFSLPRLLRHLLPLRTTAPHTHRRTFYLPQRAYLATAPPVAFAVKRGWARNADYLENQAHVADVHRHLPISFPHLFSRFAVGAFGACWAL